MHYFGFNSSIVYILLKYDDVWKFVFSVDFVFGCFCVLAKVSSPVHLINTKQLVSYKISRIAICNKAPCLH